MLVHVAGEPILIVDDAQVNLNLTRLLLMHEGYAVRTATRAEDAIDMLAVFRPDLILADIRLPGMDGFEMARRVKRNPQTRTIKVVAVTGSAQADDVVRAAEAGCDAYLTRPIETKVLATRIREVLDRAVKVPTDHRLPAPKPPARVIPRAALPAPAETEVEGLHRQFLTEGETKTREMLENLNAGGLNTGAAARQLHSWIGSAGLLGHPELSQRARTLEQKLLQPPCDWQEVREHLTTLMLSFSELRQSAAPSVPGKVSDALRGKRVALVGFQADGAEKMCAALAEVGARPRLFEATDGPECHPVQECDVVAVHVGPQTLHSVWLNEPGALRAGTRLVLAGQRRDLLELPSSVLGRDVELLAEPWQVEEVLLRLHMAMSRRTRETGAAAPSASADVPATGSGTAPSRPKVVLADDDGIVLTVVGSTLQNYGMTCETASNGRDALRLIRENKPNVAVLDVNMPGHDGYEVLSAVRAANLPVAVILLTARQREGDILRGFQLGADDYLVKPFNPLELMARMKRLLRR